VAEYHFEVGIAGGLSDEQLDQLAELGCDDATFSTTGELSFAEFDREAPSLLEAITSAIDTIESVDGLFVMKVGPEDLVWASEIAERAGRSRSSVNMLIKGQRGPGNFPAPTSHSTRNPLWRWSEVETWFAQYEGRQPDMETPAVIEALNGALQARLGMRHSSHPAPLRKVIRDLIAS
jgi:predicted DNA-binding transcriptional regulator AlpA